jgi:hypothetical protein
VPPVRRPPPLRILLALALAMFTISGVAHADVGTKIIERCARGESISGFSQQAYRKALQEIPTEVEEYSDCGELIHKAQLDAASGVGAAPPAPTLSSSEAIPTTPAEQHAIAQAHKTGEPVQVGDQIIHPGVVHANIASAISALPTPLLAVLVLLLACGIVLAGAAIRHRVIRDRHTD